VATDCERVLLKMAESLAVDSERLDKRLRDIFSTREPSNFSSPSVSFSTMAPRGSAGGPLLLGDADASLASFAPEAPVRAFRTAFATSLSLWGGGLGLAWLSYEKVLLASLLPEYGSALCASGSFACAVGGMAALGLKRVVERRNATSETLLLKEKVVDSVRKRYTEELEETHAEATGSVAAFAKKVRVEREELLRVDQVMGALGNKIQVYFGV
jgi:hypothetical protein